MMTRAPATASAAPARSVRVGAWPSTTQSQASDADNVDSAVCRVRSSRKRGIHTGQREGESDKAGDSDERDSGSAAPPQPDPEREAAGDFEERREREECDVGSHVSSKALTKSRVPDGPVRSKNTGPPSGSTVIPNRRKRQQCRSASTACAISAIVSARRCKLETQSIGQFLATFGTSHEIHQQALSARPQGLRRQRASDRQFGHGRASSTILRDHAVILDRARGNGSALGQQRRDDVPRGVE